MPEPARAVSDEHVAQVFRSLATEHCAKRATLERELAWRCIAGRANERARRRPSWLGRLAWPAAVALCAVCAALGWTYRPMLEYELVGTASVSDGEIRSGSTGASLVFSDGSTVEAKAHSAFSLSIVGQHAALTRLSRGTLNVAVRHDEDSDFRFLAGPYELRVVGTRFEMSWEPETSALAVHMHEGQVRIIGPGQLDRTVTAGQRFERTGAGDSESARGEHRVAAKPRSASGLGASAASSAPREAELRAARNDLVPPAARETVAPNDVVAPPPIVPPEEDWPSLVARGEFAEVVDAAERVNIEHALATRDADDLKALAQSASYTGYTPLALRSWMAIRDRFAGHAAAKQAAFFIGRIYDEMSESGPAREWLDTYLDEAADGVFASEALGRRLSLARRTDQHDEALEFARTYLERFPGGAYAGMARAVLTPEGPSADADDNLGRR